MNKFNKDYWPQFKLRRWLDTIGQNKPVSEKLYSPEDLEIEAIAEKLKEDFPEYPQVSRNMDLDGKPYQYDSSLLRIKGLDIKGDKIIFTFDLDPEQPEQAYNEIRNFFGRIGFHHFSNSGCNSATELKHGRYAIYESNNRSINDCIKEEDSCQIAVMREDLLRFLQMGFTLKISAELQTTKAVAESQYR